MHFLKDEFLVLKGNWIFFYSFGDPVVGISILNRMVLPLPLEDLDTMLLNLFSSKEESLSLDSCGTNISFNIIDSDLLCYGFKLDFGGMFGIFVKLSFVLSCNFSTVVHDMLLTSLLPISTGCNVPIRVALGIPTLPYAILSMDMLRYF